MSCPVHPQRTGGEIKSIGLSGEGTHEEKYAKWAEHRGKVCVCIPTFKIMHYPARKEIPWEMIAPHEVQAQQNHGQTLARLNERGGLSPCEAVAVLEDRRWRKMDAVEADARLEQLVWAWENWVSGT